MEQKRQKRLKGILKHYNLIHILMFIVVIVLLLAGLFSLLFYFRIKGTLYDSAYRQPESSYYSDFYAGKKVMFLVPHEDDEYNLGSGVIEQYINAGSDVTIVWLTNGDAYGNGEIRIVESMKAMAKINVPEENMIFLGYGDSWETGEYEHIYHAPDDYAMTSMCGLTETYGVSGHPDYHTLRHGEPAKYTRRNIISDIKEVIEEKRPDVIYAIDCDSHPDHRAMSLFSEEVIGNIMAKEPNYRPRVFKGFGYCTAWIGVRDYYAMNVLSTKSPYDTDYMQEKPQYIWAERARLPVYSKTLADTRQASSAYDVISSYDSQNALESFDCIVNSDKIFWEKRVDSVMYDATISASSGDSSCINDFKLCDSTNIRREKIKWKHGIWAPEKSDKDMTLAVEFAEPKDINQIVIYDSCYKDCDILDSYITFSDGSRIDTGKLNPLGDATTFEFDTKEKISGFCFTITDRSNEDAGVSEIEAYYNMQVENPEFIKLTIDDNFAYDYKAQKGDRLDLGVYGYPLHTENNICELYVDGEYVGDIKGSVDDSQNDDASNGLEYVYDGKEHVLRVALKSNRDIYDECYLSSYTFCDRIMIDYARKIEDKSK